MEGERPKNAKLAQKKRSRHIAIVILIGALLFLYAYPKQEGPLESCDCIGIHTVSGCYGMLYSCMADYEVTAATEKQADLEVTLVIDTSQSMEGEKIQKAILASEEMIDSLRSDERVAILRFDQEAKVVRQFTSDKGQVKEALRALEVSGKTRYIPALNRAYSNILEFGQADKDQVLILISDQKLDDSEFYKDILTRVKKISSSGICINTIGYGELRSIDESLLQQISDISLKRTNCGSHYTTKQGDKLKGILSDIEESIRKGGTTPIRIISPTPGIYNDTAINLSYQTALPGCSYSINGGNSVSLQGKEVMIMAHAGRNFLRLTCQDEYSTVLFDVAEPITRLLDSIERGTKLNLQPNDKREVLEEVLSHQNISILEQEKIIGSIIDREQETDIVTDVYTNIEKADGKTHVEARIETDNELGELDVYMKIPKCMAEKLNELVFYDDNFKIIAEDPLIMWHFAEVTEDIDISYEVLKEIERECEEQLSIIPVAGVIGESLSGMLFRNILPLLIIPLIVILYASSIGVSIEDHKYSASGRRRVTFIVMLVVFLVLLYPKDTVREDPDEVTRCECFGYDRDAECFGLIHSCSKEARYNTPDDLRCEESRCIRIEDYLRLDDFGDLSFIDVDLTLILDRSKSMEGERLENAKLAAKSLIDMMGKNDRAAIVRFDERAELAQQFTDNRQLLKAKIDEINVGGRTRYIPALEIAKKNYMNSNEERLKMIIFVSDGQPDDSGRPHSIYETVRDIAGEDICLHTIGYGDAISTDSEAEITLKGMAHVSQDRTACGEYRFAPEGEGALVSIFEDIYKGVLEKGALRIGTEHDVDYEDEIIRVRANVRSAFNDRPVPGFSGFKDLCAPPASIRAYIEKDREIIKSLDLSYTGSQYEGYTSDLDKGEYRLATQAQIVTPDGEICGLSGSGRTDLQIAQKIGDLGCAASTCESIGNYIAYTPEFRTIVEVLITDDEFKPQSVLINDGTTVVWKNIGKKNHSVKSQDFESGIIPPGETYTRKFSRATNLSYIDNMGELQGSMDVKEKARFAFSENHTVDLMLVMDHSGSMTGERLDSAREAAKRFVNMLYENDRASIVVFSDQARLVHPFSSNKESLTRAIDKTVATGSTKYLPPLEMVDERFSREDTSGRKLAIFLSDGEPWDDDKDAIIEEVRTLVRSGICLYTIGYGDAITPGSSAETLLKRMAQISKDDKKCGEYYYAVQSTGMLTDIFGEIYKEVMILEGLSVNATLEKDIMRPDENNTISARVRSKYNDNTVPGTMGETSCAPSAIVEAAIEDIRGEVVKKVPVLYSDGLYKGSFTDLNPGFYNLEVEARARTSTGDSCNFVGSESLKLIVVQDEEEGSTTKFVFNSLIIAVCLLGILLVLAARLLKKPDKV